MLTFASSDRSLVTLKLASEKSPRKNNTINMTGIAAMIMPLATVALLELIPASPINVVFLLSSY